VENMDERGGETMEEEGRKMRRERALT